VVGAGGVMITVGVVTTTVGVVTTTVGVVSVAVLAVGAASPPPPQPARLIRAALAMANDIHLNCVFMSVSPDKKSETRGQTEQACKGNEE
jgi:hypothetical protein